MLLFEVVIVPALMEVVIGVVAMRAVIALGWWCQRL